MRPNTTRQTDTAKICYRNIAAQLKLLALNRNFYMQLIHKYITVSQ